MLNVYNITYKLSNHDGTPFNRCRLVYSANLVADNERQATDKLKSMFNMLKCDIIGKPGLSHMTEEEYENG